MPSPFPGMDPYLEHPDYWPECHNRLIVAMADALVPFLRPKYEVAIEKRIYEVENTNGDSSLLIGIPDVAIKQRSQTLSQPGLQQAASPSTFPEAETLSQPIAVAVPLMETIKQTYLEVRELATGRVITAIEILSPVNKRTGEGRNDYLKKRRRILNSTTHLVEVDLLRAFSPMPLASEAVQGAGQVLVSRSGDRPHANLYVFGLQEPLPTFPLPLQSEDAEPIVALQVLLNQVYDRAGFDYRIDYSLDPPAPLSENDQIWVAQQLQAKGLRSQS